MLDENALISDAKADFNKIYEQPDPRAYFRTLAPLDYQIPQQALPVIEAVLAAAAPAGVLDVCCSYGINAMLLRHRLGMAELSSHFAGAGSVTADREFFAARRRHPAPEVYGLDVAGPAIDYGLRTGLLTAGWAENLEEEDPSPELAAGLRDVGAIISTGGVGYVGPPTFDRLLGAAAAPEDLWAVIFVLRVFDYATVAESFSRYGLVTEQVPGVTFPQRRFADGDERDAAVHDVVLRGLDPAGREAAGWYHADCFVTRPAGEAARTTLAELLAPGTLPIKARASRVDL